MKKITIYTGPLCNYCEAAKRLLTRNNASYNEINIATVDGAMEEMLKKANKLRENDGYIIDSLGWAYFAKKDYDVDVSLFSRFEELHTIHKALKDNGFDVNDPEIMEIFHKSLDQKELRMAIHTRVLAKAITHKECKDLILQGKFREARIRYKEIAPEATSSRYSAIKRALNSLRSFTADDLSALKEEEGDKNEHLTLIKELISNAERVIKMSEVM